MSTGPLLLSLLATALKAGVLLALAGGIAWSLRRAPARTRHTIWTGALVGALLLPVLAPWVPDWKVAALPAPWLSTDRPAPDVRTPRLAPLGRRASRSESLIATTTSTAAVAAARPTEPSHAATGPALWGRLTAVRPTTWLLGGWLLGCLASLGWFLRALRAARRLERGAAAADAAWRRQLERARRLVGLRRPVRLLHSRETATPMTWGWLRPVILMPARSSGWSEERRRIVLLHELAHVRRGDWLVRLVARLACSVYWFNPLVWAAARRLTVEQEIACDEEVVALGTRPSSYARHLLAIARAHRPAIPTPAHALDMARRSQMEGRLMSILDGSRHLRGGRKLAILALLLIAGLVPALAAIEPWVEERERQELSPGEQAAASISAAETEGLARALGELEALERKMEPFEAELESLESEIEPIERQLEGIEVEMEPVEVELEGFEAELEPFELLIDVVEVEMEPHQARLEAIEAELEPFEESLEAIEAEMQPFQERLEGIEVELRPFEDRLEAIEVEMEPLTRELERLSEEMEPLARLGGERSAELERLAAETRRVHESMEPLHAKMGAIHREMQPIYQRMSRIHSELEPMYAQLRTTHAEMRPVFAKMRSVHRELEPLHQRMAKVHLQMKPVYERMSAVHERMSPIHERMGEHHQRMEPVHRKMGEVHERMRPLHEEMGQRHLELERELTAVVERMLATQLGGVTSASTDYAPAAARIADAVSLRVSNGTLRIMSSAPQLREILDEALAGQITAAEPEFAAAAERFVRALGDLEVRAP